MSVDILRDSASTRSQSRRNLKGEGYMLKNRKLARHIANAGIVVLSQNWNIPFAFEEILPSAARATDR
ncbi:hypothetical protein Rin_00000030 [Candidatus Regiella insecticola 5.15]|uniref:Uncharacterized protein n=1 Tax=Candidatus Regiella insecticola 5.15 TaxID=1005043 RepID=G2GW76_9ENTR|nr:hypothetical protein [Candidatus Regiella insecticola]EGY30001.1 hypothetical protein Rin_00000030 [Candidatus Regiella insecticola 5.15]